MGAHQGTAVSRPEDDLTRIEEIFNQARKLKFSERSEFLRQACAGNDGLRGEIESLLDAEESMEPDFLEPLDGDIPGNHDLAMDLVEGDLVGAYRIIREIGRGGMGKVYLATRDDGVFQQQVAIKVLKKGLDSEEITRRFRHERRLLGALEHPNIVRIQDGGTFDSPKSKTSRGFHGMPYFVMEHVEGEHIDSYCDEHQLSLHQRLALFQKVCEAVAFAHRNLVVHRDLKPGNILVNERGEPKLLDFGVAKLLDPDEEAMTQANVRPMTPKYASPEQFLGATITTASDVYSLGRILRELLPDQLQRDLESITLKALEKEPQDRYSSVEQLRDDIGRFLAGLPVEARQGRTLYRVGKFVRRHRWSVTLASLALTGLLAFGLGMKILRDQAVQERRLVEEMTQLLVEMFRNSDPNVSGELQMTLKDLLDEQSEQITERLKSEPEMRETLINVMGQAYLGLGLPEQAEPLLEESLRLSRMSNQAPPVELAAVLFQVAEAKMGRDDHEGAEALVREALEILHREKVDDPSMARAVNNLGLLLKRRGDLREAESFLRESLEMRIRLYGEEHEDVATGKHNLASVLREQGQYVAAEKLYLESLLLKKAIYGPDSLEASTTVNSLALLQIDRKNPKTAEQLLRRVLEIRSTVYDSSHPTLGNTLVNLGLALRLRGETAPNHEKAGHYEAANAFFSEALRIFREVYGNEHSRVAIVRRHQALLWLAEGRVEEAAEAAREALTVFYATQPRGHWQIGEAESVLGACWWVLGRKAEAVPLLLSGYETLRAAKGDQARRTVEAAARREILFFFPPF